MEKSRAAWDLGHSALVDGLDYLPSEIFGVGFHQSMIACGSSVLIYAVEACTVLLPATRSLPVNP